MSSGRAKLYTASRDKQRAAKRAARAEGKHRRRVRQLEARRDELLEERRTLIARGERVTELERRIAELEAGYQLVVEEQEGRKRLAIFRGFVLVWATRFYHNVKPRHMRRARRVLDAFERNDP